MSAPALHLGAVVTCSHAGPAQPTMPYPRVLLSGQPLVTISSTYSITGCALSGSGSLPCAMGQWITGSLRVVAGGIPVATMAGASTCIPTGTPMMPISAQVRVVMT